MKATGIVRKVDELGRMVIPIELRKTMNIDKNDPVEIYVEGDSIIIKKYEPHCIFCGSSENTLEYNDRTICRNCIKEINSQN